MECYLAQSGSAPLNFDVKAYASEALLLAATPKENTIGIITTTPIARWTISAERPEVMTDGDVWISSGTSSTVEFNALKKGGIQVYPLSAKQMVSGELKDVTAKSWQGGKWVDWWDGYTLYDSGNQITAITGGWEANTKMKWYGDNYCNPSRVVFNSSYIDFLNGYAIANTVNRIDVTKYKKIYFDCELTGQLNSDGFGIIADYGDVYYNYTATVRCSKSGRQTLYINVESISGEYYIFAAFSGRTGKLYKVWAE